MQIRIIPKPRERNEVLDVLRVIGIVTYEDNDRILLQFDNHVSLHRLTRDYPELGALIFGQPSKNGKGAV